MISLFNKTAIVVGGCGLIGSAIVRVIKECGAKVYIIDPEHDGEEPRADYNVIVNAAYPKDHNEHLNIFLNVTYNACEDFKRRNCMGSIINLASIYGVIGPDDRIYEGTDLSMPQDYSVAKGAIIAHSRCMATRYAKYGIRVNCVSPGGVYDNQPEQFVKAYSNRVPLGRMATPEDIAWPVAFLASDGAGYITGQNILIDGGLTAW